jgi:hypothetical protein
MAEERIVIDTFDVNGIDDEDPVFKLIRKHHRDAYGTPDSKLVWRTVPNKGAMATLVDALPRDGNVEIDFTAQPWGMHLHVMAIPFGYVAPNRPADAPKVGAYAKELAKAIRKRWPETLQSKTSAALSSANTKRTLPEKSPVPETEDYTWDDVFDWFYRVPRGRCPTVSDLIGMVGKPERTFYLQKSNYEAEYGQGPMLNGKSKFG